MAADDGAGALELTWTQTLYTAPLIAGMCLASVRDPVAGLLCTGVATAGTAVLSSHLSEGVAAGQAQFIESVGPWLVGAGLRMAVTFDASVSQLGAGIAGLGYLSGPFIGMATASRTADPGTVALANSLGIWSAFGIELVRVAWSDRGTGGLLTRSHRTAASALGTIAGAGVGILWGAALGKELRPRRSQVWALDGLALAGTALFGAVGQAVGPSLCSSCNREQSTARGATIGLAVGAALGLWRLPNWTGPDGLALQPRLGVSLDGTTVVGVGAEW